MAPAVYSDKAREGKQGKTLSLRDKGTERYAGGRTPGRASLSGWARGSDSPYVETIMHGRTLSDDSHVRPAEFHWHMVFVRKAGEARVVFVGPWTTTGVAHFKEGAEVLWIKFGLGTYMPHMPLGRFSDVETVLPDASSRSFWLKGSAWEFPGHENAETFVERLVRGGVLIRDPLIDAALRGRPQDLSPRTVRHRFLRATGLTRGRIHQIERAQAGGGPLATGASDLRRRPRGRILRSTAPYPVSQAVGRAHARADFADEHLSRLPFRTRGSHLTALQ